MNKRIFVVLVPLVLLLNFAFAQTAPGIQWQNTIGGSDNDLLNEIARTADGGYILGGVSYSNISGDKTENSNGHNDFWIVKTDSIGNIQWQNTVGGSGGDALYCIQQTSDMGYILGGYSASDVSGDKTEHNWDTVCNPYCSSDYWLIKTDSLGDIQWQNTIGGSGMDRIYCVQQTSDKGYILGGQSNSNVSGDKTENSNGDNDFWIVKTDSFGNIQWQNTIGGDNEDQFTCLEQTIDKGYILAGFSLSNLSGDKTESNIGGYDYWIVKIDSTGSIQWQNTIGGISYDYLYSVVQTTDGGYLLGGYSHSNISGDKTENSIGAFANPDYWIVKTDSLGSIVWQNTIGGDNGEELHSIQQTTDGGFILGGSSSSSISGDKTENNIGNGDYWIIKTNSVGVIQWQNTIGGSNADRLYSIQETTDGGYIAGGWSNSNISGDKSENNIDTSGFCVPYCTYDYWIIKLYPDTITSTSAIPNSSLNISISPNPTTNLIHFNKENLTAELYDISGRKLLQQKISNKQLSLKNFVSGIYFLKVAYGVGEKTFKIIKQ